MSRDPKAEAVVDRFTRLTGEEGAFLSDREIETEMEDQGWPVSHERIRQYRADEWKSIQRATLRKLMAYNEWKAATLAAEGAVQASRSANVDGTGGTPEESTGDE